MTTETGSARSGPPRRRWRLNLLLVALLLLLAGLPLAVWLDLRGLSETVLSRQASDIDSLVSSIRSYYGRNIVGRVLANHPGQTEVTADYHNVPGAIPIPATLSLELGQVISEKQNEIRYRFVSDYPFRNRPAHELDAFERDALRRLRQDPRQTIVDRSWSGLNAEVRVVTPVMMEAACVSCHNSHPDSPRHDWSVGDVRGLQEVIINRPIAAGLASFKYLLAYFALAGCATLLIIWRERRHAAFERRTSLELAQKNSLLEVANARVEAELAAARSLQAAILPQNLPQNPSYAGTATMIPAREMGGDFYDFFPVGERHLGLVIADVSGKGVAAAFFMAISRTVMQSSARDHASPGACLAQANTMLCGQNPLDMFVTTFYGMLEVETGRLAYANGGHNPPMIIRARDGMVLDLPRTGGMALGILPDLEYRESSVMLEVGDTLFFYTDGISEAMNPAGQEFTEDRLRAALAGCALEPVETILKRVASAVSSFVGTAPQSDDITCLVIRYLGRGRVEARAEQRKQQSLEAVWRQLG